MGYTVVALGVGVILSPGLSHHGEPDPLRTEKTDHPGDHNVSHQYLKTPVLIQGIINLLEVQKYLMEDRLPHGRKLLE